MSDTKNNGDPEFDSIQDLITAQTVKANQCAYEATHDLFSLAVSQRIKGVFELAEIMTRVTGMRRADEPFTVYSLDDKPLIVLGDPEINIVNDARGSRVQVVVQHYIFP